MAIRVPHDVLEGIEAVRRSGLTNMFDRFGAVKIARTMGLETTAVWIGEHPGDYARGLFQGFDREDS